MSDTMCYIGVKPCGCVPAIAVDGPECRDGLGQDIAEWIDSGLTIERVLLTEGQKRFGRCRCGESIDLFEEAT